MKIQYLLTVIIGSFLLFSFNSPAPLERPNIIYIYTDQQSASMMSCAGNEWMKTPAMDYIAENGGCMHIPQVSDEILGTTLSSFLKQADYELIFGGKEHLPPSLTPAALGFTDITDNEREILAEEAAKVIRAEHKKTYFMLVSLINPHDICYMAIREFAVS